LTRAKILRAAGVPYSVMRPMLDEMSHKVSLVAIRTSPIQTSLRLAELKALSLDVDDDDIVIGADQTMELNDEILNKPKSISEIRERLYLIRGRKYALHASACIAIAGQIVWTNTQSAHISMRMFSDECVRRYLSGNHPGDISRVSGYGIDDPGIQFMQTVEGDHFAVRGLPLFPLLDALRMHGGLPA
jgi:septum formation protein